MSEEQLIIVNPNAGKRKGEKDWKQISAWFVKYDIPFKSVFTEHRDHACKLAIKYIEAGYKHIVVVGGDGTFNEVVNGIFKQTRYDPLDIYLGIIPVGTGNDWARMYGIPKQYKKAVKLIKKEKTFIQDIGKVIYHSDGKPVERYFANIAGMGYDAMVAQKTNRQKEQGKGGSFSYFYNIFTSLFSFKHTPYEITVDGNTTKGRIFSVSVGINKYNGGGMKQLPNAVPDDGLLDVTLINSVGKMVVIKHVKDLYDGSFIEMPQVDTYQGKTINIKTTNPIFLEADGESLGHSPFDFDIVPKSLKTIIGEVDQS